MIKLATALGLHQLAKPSLARSVLLVSLPIFLGSYLRDVER